MRYDIFCAEYDFYEDLLRWETQDDGSLADVLIDDGWRMFADNTTKELYNYYNGSAGELCHTEINLDGPTVKVCIFIIDDEWIEYINTLDHFRMGHLYRFLPAGVPFFNTDYPTITDAFQKRWKGYGGMTTELSKKVGWG